MEVMLEPPERRDALGVTGADRDEERQRDAGQSGVDPRLEHGHPQHQPHEEVRRHRSRPRQIEDREPGNRPNGDTERHPGQLRGVEQRDDHDRPEIVEDGHRDQENLQAPRDTGAEERQDTQRERNVGGRRYRPAAAANGVCSVEPPVERGGGGHAASRSEGREHDLSGIDQLALDHLPLDLESDQEEEHGHQAVVDPQDQRLGECERTNPDLDRRSEQRLVEAFGARVGEDEPGGRRQHEQDAARRLEPQELMNRIADRAQWHHDPPHNSPGGAGPKLDFGPCRAGRARERTSAQGLISRARRVMGGLGTFVKRSPHDQSTLESRPDLQVAAAQGWWGKAITVSSEQILER